MTDSVVLDIGQKALSMAFMLCAPLLGLSLVVGLVISIFQAATQIHEMTLTFIPKILAVSVVLVALGPWMLHQVVSYTTNLFQSIPTLVK
ncbi:MAG: flagellar biosynthesis protein FliQ [Armatimonadota bacterium]